MRGFADSAPDPPRPEWHQHAKGFDTLQSDIENPDPEAAEIQHAAKGQEIRAEFYELQRQLKAKRLELALHDLSKEEQQAIEVLQAVMADYDAEESQLTTRLMVVATDTPSAEYDQVCKLLGEVQRKVWGLRRVLDLIEFMAKQLKG